MALMIGCGVLVGLGIWLILAWGHTDVTNPPEVEEVPGNSRGLAAVMRRYLWRVALVIGSGVGAGILMAGPGGRLVMRLLAATAPASAQGRITEAEEVVGRISQGGTIGFVIFIGVFFGLAVGVFYMLIQRWLPRGRLGGLVFGLLLLLWFSVPFDPLRPENPDFEIVGPGWLALVSFSALVVFHGMLVAAIAGRYSKSLPLFSKDRRTWLLYAPLLLLIPGFALLAVFALGALVALAYNATPDFGRIWASHRVTVAGKLLGATAMVVALPLFVIAAVEILDKSPN